MLAPCSHEHVLGARAVLEHDKPLVLTFSGTAFENERSGTQTCQIFRSQEQPLRHQKFVALIIFEWLNRIRSLCGTERMDDHEDKSTSDSHHRYIHHIIRFT